MTSPFVLNPKKVKAVSDKIRKILKIFEPIFSVFLPNTAVQLWFLVANHSVSVFNLIPPSSASLRRGPMKAQYVHPLLCVRLQALLSAGCSSHPAFCHEERSLFLSKEPRHSESPWPQSSPPSSMSKPTDTKRFWEKRGNGTMWQRESDLCSQTDLHSSGRVC